MWHDRTNVLDALLVLTVYLLVPGFYPPAASAALAVYVARRLRRLPRLRLRSTPPTVECILFGASPLAGFTYAPCSEAEAVEAVRAAVELGVCAFDTAPHYGLGVSESRLAKGLQSLPRGAPKCRVWTKVGRYLLPRDQLHSALGTGEVRGDAVEWDNMGGSPTCLFPDVDQSVGEVADYSAAAARRAHDGSVRRLALQPPAQLAGQRVHDPDTDERCAAALAPDGAVDELVRMRTAGEISEVSIGCWSNEHVLRMLRSKPRGTFDSVMLAGRWNLLDQSGAEVLAECERLGVRVHNASVFASGLLAGGWTYQNKEAPVEIKQRAAQWAALAAKYGTTLPALALQFALLPDVVELVAIGMTNRTQLEQNKAWVEERVDPRVWHDARRLGLLPTSVPLPAVPTAPSSA